MTEEDRKRLEEIIEAGKEGYCLTEYDSNWLISQLKAEAEEVKEDTGVMKVLRRRAEAVEAERAKLAQRVKVLEEALSWIAIVNACDYEYQQVARAALEEKSCPSQNPGWM